MTAFLQSSTELLDLYVAGLCEALDAEAASIFLPGVDSGRATLTHHGGGEPIPELCDPAAATAVAAMAGDTRADSIIESSCPRSVLIVLRHSRDGGGQAAAQRRASDSVSPSPPGVLGVRYATARARDAVFGNSAETDSAARSARRVTAVAAELLQQATLMSRTLEDPISGIPGRALFHVQLRRHVERAWREKRPMSLLLVSPDGYGAVNEQFGREVGDRVIGEIAKRLRVVLRSDDIIAKYGGAIFTLLLGHSSAESARTVGTKLCRTLGELPFLDGALSLSFSVGAATLDPVPEAEPDPTELLRRADRALGAARQGGGGRIEEWTVDLESDSGGRADPLSEIFTGNMAKDYRNMALLSEAMSAVAGARDVKELLSQLARRLLDLLKGEHIAVCETSEAGSVEVTYALTRKKRGGRAEFVLESSLGRDAMALATEATRTDRVVGAGVVEGTLAGGAQVHSFAVPLIARGESLGCLYLDGRADQLAVDSADGGFLKALAAQLAIALDRARLAEQQFAWQEAESHRLRAQLDELREAVQQTKLVYRSETMKSLMETARRVAATDATVLVTGESGTGKELVARAVHRLSPRRDKTCVIVDCASVPSTLIESELFGHERGAYTGAEQRKVGRLVEADGGTVILDEIGELPLEVQAKLLRFVQEKEVVPVGGSRTRKVDARVVAATNRDLGAESREGRFRADLYYRLNVVHLKVPRLSERKDDALYLARHFLQKFSVQYQKGILRRLSEESERAIEAYGWPGNVRELQNRIMQAVILSEGLEIPLDALGLDPPARETRRASEPEGVPSAHPFVARSDGASTIDAGSATQPTALRPDDPNALRPDDPNALRPDDPNALRPDDPNALRPDDAAAWEGLRDALGASIEAALSGPSATPPPIGTWLANGLVLEANASASDVMRKAADRIGMPEATFRRRLKKARASRDSGETPPPNWERIREILADLIQTATGGGDLVKRTRNLLLEDVRSRLPQDVSKGSALMGVTEPTFRRWAQELE